MRALRISLVITEDWYFWSHRRILAQSLLQRGCRVDLVTNMNELGDRIRSAGILPHSVGLSRRGRSPIGEAMTVKRMSRLLREIKPDVVHLVGMKPIIYGSLAARMARVPATVCAIAGLGWLFTPGGILKTAARTVVETYFGRSLANRSNVRFIVQNSHHRDVMVKRRMADAEQVTLISGAGVDTDRFGYTSESKGVPTVLTHGRMLWDKGIGDLVEAARMIKRRNFPCRFVLVGDPDPANPASIPETQLRAWNEEGIVEWQGRRSDIPQLLSQSHIACLPSYHEGFPLSLVEASAAGRPIVTTDIPGCRDVVDDGYTGILVAKKSPNELADALTQLILNPRIRQEMGRRGRQRVVQKMSCDIVNRQTYECYEQVLDGITLPAIPDTRIPAEPARRAA